MGLVATLQCSMCGTRFADTFDVKESPTCPSCGVSQYTEVGQQAPPFRNRSTSIQPEEGHILSDPDVYWSTYRDVNSFLESLSGMDTWAAHRVALSCAERYTQGLPISKRVAVWNAYKKMRYKKREIIGEVWNYASSFEEEAIELSVLHDVWLHLKNRWDEKYKDVSWDRVVDVVTIHGTAQDKREYSRLKWRFEALVAQEKGALTRIVGAG
jgi:hypothetical protein